MLPSSNFVEASSVTAPVTANAAVSVFSAPVERIAAPFVVSVPPIATEPLVNPRASVAPSATTTLPVPSADTLPATSVPAETVVCPVYMFVPASVTVPKPVFVSSPAPEITLETVPVAAASSSVPAFAIAPEPSAPVLAATSLPAEISNDRYVFVPESVSVPAPCLTIFAALVSFLFTISPLTAKSAAASNVSVSFIRMLAEICDLVAPTSVAIVPLP